MFGAISRAVLTMYMTHSVFPCLALRFDEGIWELPGRTPFPIQPHVSRVQEPRSGFFRSLAHSVGTFWFRRDLESGSSTPRSMQLRRICVGHPGRLPQEQRWDENELSKSTTHVVVEASIAVSDDLVPPT